MFKLRKLRRNRKKQIFLRSEQKTELKKIIQLLHKNKALISIRAFDKKETRKSNENEEKSHIHTFGCIHTFGVLPVKLFFLMKFRYPISNHLKPGTQIPI